MNASQLATYNPEIIVGLNIIFLHLLIKLFIKANQNLIDIGKNRYIENKKMFGSFFKNKSI